MSRKVHLTQAEAKILLNESPSASTKARQIARSEADRWIALSELQVEVNRLKKALLALEKRVEENERSH